VFLAHPFEYKFSDTTGFIDELRKEIALDGIECFHPSAEIDNRIDILITYARNNDLFISGGSDLHGDKKPNNEIGKGSGRSIPGFDLHEALVNLSKHLDKYGGHEMAVGLSLDKKNFNRFKEDFNKYVNDKDISDLVPILDIDKQIEMKDVDSEIVKELDVLEPFGEANRKPVFVYKNLKIDSIRALSDGKHLKLTLKDGNILINAIGFNMGALSKEYTIGDKVDIAGMLEINSFNGRDFVQINMRDIMKSL